ncbi:MAG: hypothetical protein J0L95_08040 [Candidatus Accumulibacter sp.]|uniref:hypothetical protein n=1 Tax=Accumulibacter sp. TaxID=2053492 RepID=UPI001AC50B30|nr:hypothetical protein [Accumulibacter sp.]MBN8437977.1 hypothetical protein [Accumulibacter sp.]
MTPSNGEPPNSSPASTVNLWLAVGDETGEFKDSQSSGFHGAGLILARPATLVAALNETLDGKTIRSRMDAPVEGLRNWLLAKGPEKADELRKHHVREAWQYFREKGIKGAHSLDAIPSDPVLANLLAAFRWLAGHPGIVSLGIHGSGKEVMGDFATGSDRMAVLGTLYGRTLALVRPFLGASPRIRMLPGRRSEDIDDASIRRAGQHVSIPHTGSKRQSTSNTGGNRTLLDAMERQFWETFASMKGQWPVPVEAFARQIAFAGYMNSEALVATLEREDRQAANLVRGEEARLNNLADLACSLMAASCDSARRDLSIRFSDPVGPNVRFFSVREVMA